MPVGASSNNYDAAAANLARIYDINSESKQMAAAKLILRCMLEQLTQL